MWGEPCKVKLRSIDFCGRRISVNKKTVRFWRAARRFINRELPELAKLIKSTPDTGSYNCRHIGNDPNRPWSNHAWGGSTDIRWQQNGYGLPATSSEMWKKGKPFIFWVERNGGYWGGRWSTPDAMHIECGIPESECKERWTVSGKRKKRRR